MDKGWGLTLDSDPPPPLSSSFFLNPTSTAPNFFRLKQQRDSMFQFPVSLGGSRDDVVRHGTSSNSSSPNNSDHDHNNRVRPVDEVDFFSVHKKHRIVDDDDQDNKITSHVNVKKESSPAPELDVNVSFFLSFFLFKNQIFS